MGRALTFVYLVVRHCIDSLVLLTCSAVPGQG
jgi:hypothetical protein